MCSKKALTEIDEERWTIFLPKCQSFFNGNGDCLYYIDGVLVAIQRKNGVYIDKTKHKND